MPAYTSLGKTIYVEGPVSNTLSTSREAWQGWGENKNCEQRIHSTTVDTLGVKHLLSLNAIKSIVSKRFQMPHPIIPSCLKFGASWSASGQNAVLLDPDL